MRIAALKSVLMSIAGVVLFVLGAGQAAAAGPCFVETDITYYLIFHSGNLVLSTTPPGTGLAAYVDSPALSKAGGNPWQLIDEWEVPSFGGSGGICLVTGFSDLDVWLGLRNSDDQGTNFDLRADVYLDDTTLVGRAEQDCIKGLTRNPALAQEVVQSIVPQADVTFDGNVSIKLYARIGTGPSCTGHASATGLRVYFNSADRDSQFDIKVGGPL